MYVCPERAAQAGKAALAAATALSTSWGPLAATQHSSCPLLGSQLVKAPGESIGSTLLPASQLKGPRVQVLLLLLLLVILLKTMIS